MKRDVDVVVDLRAPVDRVVVLLTENPAVVFEPDAADDARAAGRFRCDLAVDVADGATLRHEVMVELGRATPTDAGATIDLRLEPVGHRHLLPRFDGGLEARRDGEDTKLELRGSYEPPLGVVGRVGDVLGGHRSVERSLVSFVTEMAHRLREEVDRRPAPPPAGAPGQPEPPDRRSDYYLG